MNKLKIGARSFIDIKKDNGIVDYKKWVNFIESHSTYFVWYRDTENGKNVMKRINEFSEKGKETILYLLDKKCVHVKSAIVNNRMCPALTYEKESIRVELDRKISKDFAAVILDMAKFLDAKVIVDDKIEFTSIEQLE